MSSSVNTNKYQGGSLPLDEAKTIMAARRSSSQGWHATCQSMDGSGHQDNIKSLQGSDEIRYESGHPYE